MSESIIPTSYEQWRHCIEVRCHIQLTPQYIDERLAELENTHHAKTREFAKLYGTDHLERTIGWFRQASHEVTREAGSRHA
ncbi:MAG: hypothetical protein ACF8AM_20055 [Rhodopirellula sp. JB055]|uniref:hypothetical protein n=1 Tax=Rhodopirellula sp. JB055 TaxID=3342846 RepID=UPI00370B09A2